MPTTLLPAFVANKKFVLQPRNIVRPARTAAPPPAAPRQLQSGLAPYTGNWGFAEAAHLLNRTTFGATLQNINTLLAMNLSNAVDMLLNPAVTPPPPPVNNYNGDVINDPDVPLGETWVNAPFTEVPEIIYGRFISLKTWWYYNMRYQQTHIIEKLLLFWHNHFATQAGEIFEPRITYRHLQTLRQHALGNFKDMTRAVTLDTQMLLYLNGAFNVATAPDENYARELQELFCIGKGPGSQYTEEDVQAAARVLTGWTINPFDLSTVFWAPNHDTGNKQFSAFYGNTIIAGQAGANGANELDQLLNMLFDTQECALFICRELYRFFVYHQIDEDTEINVIAPLADVFRDNNYDIAPVLNTLLKSEHFFDVLNRAAVIKSPVDYLIGQVRVFNTPFPPQNLYNESWAFGQALEGILSQFKQVPGDPPDVAGWPAYYQVPQFDKLWITTDSYPRRLQVADYLLYVGYYYTDTDIIKIDPIAFTAALNNPADINDLIYDATNLLLAYPVGQEVKDQLKAILLSGQTADYYWTLAWNYLLDNPTDETAYVLVYTRLAGMYRYLLQLEEYQLM
ncbi:DUF1800 domain-containing protein [Sphingobacteriales bacterium UPWRP_1]|nr:hypothetical protein B6N25_16720 [Sphingobacteriales bacterium TSM_CSS]PSJ73571.1 DUF1800 domain-containing protein [Sphingobacteriales bacterium UPWRP_1]